MIDLLVESQNVKDAVIGYSFSIIRRQGLLFYKQTQKGDYHSKNLVGRENLHLINTMEIYGIAFKGVLYVVVEI